MYQFIHTCKQTIPEVYTLSQVYVIGKWVNKKIDAIQTGLGQLLQYSNINQYTTKLSKHDRRYGISNWQCLWYFVVM